MTAMYKKKTNRHFKYCRDGLDMLIYTPFETPEVLFESVKIFQTFQSIPGCCNCLYSGKKAI